MTDQIDKLIVGKKHLKKAIELFLQREDLEIAINHAGIAEEIFGKECRIRKIRCSKSQYIDSAIKFFKMKNSLNLPLFKDTNENKVSLNELLEKYVNHNDPYLIKELSQIKSNIDAMPQKLNNPDTEKSLRSEITHKLYLAKNRAKHYDNKNDRYIPIETLEADCAHLIEMASKNFVRLIKKENCSDHLDLLLSLESFMNDYKKNKEKYAKIYTNMK